MIVNKHNTIRLISIIVVLLSIISFVVACSRPIWMLRGTIAGEDGTQEISALANEGERQETSTVADEEERQEMSTVADEEEVQETSATESEDERLEIINFIKSIKLVLKDHSDFYEDVDKLPYKEDLSPEQAIDILEDLKKRMEMIYTDVAESNPPPALREFKRKWTLECELLIKSLDLAIQSMKENDVDLDRESGYYKSWASRLRNEYQEELLDVLVEYEISVSELK